MQNCSSFLRLLPSKYHLQSFLKDYLDERKLRLWDFFRNIDKDGTMRVPVADFRRAVQVDDFIDSAVKNVTDSIE